MAITWCPKATVQAVLGPVALETARHMKSGSDVEQLAASVLTLAALSILITAPLGALAVQLCGPRMLSPPAADSRSNVVAGPAETETPFISRQELLAVYR